MSFFLKLEASGGSAIETCADEAIDIAEKIGVTVLFDFNGIKCMACKGDSGEELAKETLRLIKKAPKGGYAFKPIARGGPLK